MKNVLRLGTRKSPLALAQVKEVLTALRKVAPKVKAKIIPIDTAGDKDKKTPISGMEGTDFFTREIDRALLRKKIDCAVHSAKDLPEIIPEGIKIAAITRSVDPYDVLVSRDGLKLAELPRGARVGTSSERRKSQLKAYRPDLTLVDIRGTMQERVDKLESQDLDAVVIASAGLIRLGLSHVITERIKLHILKPHPWQGSLAVTIRKEDKALKDLFSKLDKKRIASRSTYPSTKKKKILVTGTSAERFKSRGEIVHVPIIAIKPVKSFKRVDAFIKNLARYDGIIFTSKYTVQYFLQRLKRKAKGLTVARGKNIIAIGKTTAKHLRSYGLPATLVAQEETAEGIVKMLKRRSLKGKGFLIPRSKLASDRMVHALRKGGAHVDTVTVYLNVPTKAPKRDLQTFDEIIFTSPSTVRNFLKIYRNVPKPIKMKAAGPVTQAYLKTCGFISEII